MDKYSLKPIGELCDIVKGTTGLASAIPGEYPLVATGADLKSANTYQFDTEAVCIPLVSSTGHGKKTLNYVHYQEGKFALGTILAALIPKDKTTVSAAYLHRYLQFYKDRKIVPLMRGAANVSLAVKDIAKIEVPVPPIDQQINFIKLFNKLHHSGSELQNTFSFQSSTLNKLRQAILQEAIEGKLTADWRKANPVRKGDPDYDAEALLAEIKAEKQKMIDEGKIKKTKHLAPIKKEDLPFELPEGWVWARLGEISELITSGSRDWARYYRDNGRAKFIRMGNLSHEWFYLNENSIQYVEPPIDGEGTRSALIEDDLLVSITGDVGWKALIPADFGEAYINQHTALIRVIQKMRGKFVPIILCSPFAKKQFNEPQRGIKNSFRLSDISSHMIPLPPLAEQHTMVERIEKLFDIVAELETQLKDRQAKADMLLQAVLREAFEEVPEQESA